MISSRRKSLSLSGDESPVVLSVFNLMMGCRRSSAAESGIGFLRGCRGAGATVFASDVRAASDEDSPSFSPLLVSPCRSTNESLDGLGVVRRGCGIPGDPWPPERRDALSSSSTGLEPLRGVGVRKGAGFNDKSSGCSLKPKGVAISPGVGVSLTQFPGMDGRKGFGCLGAAGSASVAD